MKPQARMQSTLCTLREEIQRLASTDGRYRVVSVETGASPVPVRELRFPSRSTGATATLVVESVCECPQTERVSASQMPPAQSEYSI